MNSTYLAGIVLSALAGLAVLLMLYRFLRPASTPKFRDDQGRIVPGSLAELISIAVNGTQQWLLIRGRSDKNPVLLFLHGGPGTAMIGVARRIQKMLEKHFIVVQWDQRGAGLSGLNAGEESRLTREQLVSDGAVVTEYLFNRFGSRKIVLVGHSWGSALGYMLAHRHPQWYAAFFGLGQISHRTESAAYEATLERARSLGNRRAVRELTELGPPPYRDMKKQVRTMAARADADNAAMKGMLTRFAWSSRLGGDARGFSITRIFITDLLLSREYRLKTALQWIKNKNISINTLYNECNADIDLFSEGTEFRVPVYFLLGDYDLLTVPSGAEKLFGAITAPDKDCIHFSCAHEIPWEKTAEYQRVICEILQVDGK